MVEFHSRARTVRVAKFFMLTSGQTNVTHLAPPTQSCTHKHTHLSWYTCEDTDHESMLPLQAEFVPECRTFSSVPAGGGQVECLPSVPPPPPADSSSSSSSPRLTAKQTGSDLINHQERHQMFRFGGSDCGLKPCPAKDASADWTVSFILK